MRWERFHVTCSFHIENCELCTEYTIERCLMRNEDEIEMKNAYDQTEDNGLVIGILLINQPPHSLIQILRNKIRLHFLPTTEKLFIYVFGIRILPVTCFH